MTTQYSIQPPPLEYLSGRHVLLALSGGADSAALLDMLSAARDAGLIRLSAAHFCHGIRGSEALADAEFCRRVCLARNVAYYSGSGDVPAEAARTSEGLETAARRMRYDFLEKTRVLSGADVIALAHHADDQAETVLMHLLRGTGLSGMKGMAQRSGRLVRPLLHMKKAEIYAYLRERGLEWREDSTNALADNPRNILRLEALPAMQRAYPGAADAICRHAEIIRAEDELLQRMTNAFLAEKRRTFPFGIHLALNGREETAILRRALREMLGSFASADNIRMLEELARRERGAMDISRVLRAEKCPGGLYLLRLPQPTHPAAALRLPGDTILPGLGKFSAVYASSTPIRSDPMRQALRPDALRNAQARTRLPGDRIHPLGMDGGKTLSDYMTDRRLDRPLRDHTPLLAVDHEVLWAVGLGISRFAALETPGEAVIVTFTQEEFSC